jgi:hypothetical protein
LDKEGEEEKENEKDEEKEKYTQHLDRKSESPPLPLGQGGAGTLVLAWT